MTETKWPDYYSIKLAPDYEINLPLIDIGGGFNIYSFDMTGEAEWNRVAADQLKIKLSEFDYDSFITVQTKSSGLTQAISGSHKSYLELRKSRKGFMKEPKHITVKSITTEDPQELWIGKEKYGPFQGKSCALSMTWYQPAARSKLFWQWRRRLDSPCLLLPVC